MKTLLIAAGCLLACSLQAQYIPRPGVSSVGVTGANGIGVAGSPVTGSGTITLSLAGITPSAVTINGGTAITLVKSETATLDFPNTLAAAESDLTVTVAGAADGDQVILSYPNASVDANGSYKAWVSAPNTVTVRFRNNAVTAINPASGTFRCSIIKF